MTPIFTTPTPPSTALVVIKKPISNPLNRRLFPCICKHCGITFETFPERINRAEKIGAPMYCGKVCAGLGRRNPNKLTGDSAKQAKSAYDAKRREEKRDEINAKKMAYYFANHERFKAEHAVYRAKHMQRHVKYCQRPEYKAWKAEYDRQHLAKKKFGEFAESALLLQDLEVEIDSRATRYEIYQSNGTLNKSLQRKRAL